MEIQLKLRNYEKWRVGLTNLNTFGNLMIPENVKNISNVGKYDKIGGKYGGGSDLKILTFVLMLVIRFLTNR